MCILYAADTAATPIVGLRETGARNPCISGSSRSKASLVSATNLEDGEQIFVGIVF